MLMGDRLKEWGKKHYKTMVAFAEVLEIDYTTLHRYINNKRKPAPKTLLKLNELNCDLHWLITGEYTSDTQQMTQAVTRFINEEQNPYLKRIKQLEEENKKLKAKIAVYEKAAKYMAKAESS